MCYVSRYIWELYLIKFLRTLKKINDLLQNNLVFVPATLVNNQILSIVYKIYAGFDNPSLEIRANFLNNSKAFRRIWNDGLLSKVSGKRVNLLQRFISNRSPCLNENTVCVCCIMLVQCNLHVWWHWNEGLRHATSELILAVTQLLFRGISH